MWLGRWWCHFTSVVKLKKKKKKDVQRIIIAVLDRVLVLEWYPKKIQHSETESKASLVIIIAVDNFISALEDT